MAANAAVGPAANTANGFNVVGYTVEGNPMLSTNVLVPILSPYTGTNVSLTRIAEAAAAVQAEYHDQGYPWTSIAVAWEQITNGIVTLNLFQTAVPQIVISGVRYFPTNGLGLVLPPSVAAAGPAPPAPPGAAATHAAPPLGPPPAPPSPAQLAQARSALLGQMSELSAREKDTRIHVVSTNAGPRFAVDKYLVSGNTILSPQAVGRALTNIDGAFGTNVSFDGVRTAVEQLQQAYRERGYVTVAVGLPQQKLTNQTVRLQVTEGRLDSIVVAGNRYFSSNNVMRALPSLHTNLVLNEHVFQAELNRANANQDRQIYPLIGPGAEPGASKLTLTVKDRLPVHAKVEFNNENSPGTPDLRVNGSAVAGNLWQADQSLGVQYSFSPQFYKQGSYPWNFYDEPLVANYSGFYRLPLGNPPPLEEVIENNPGNFGYSEATRQFRLPPPSGRAELNLFASRSTIDTGLLGSAPSSVADIPGFLSITRQTDQENLTINNDLGARLSVPAGSSDDFQSTFSAGPDFKTYDLLTYATNVFFFSITTINPQNNQASTTTATDNSPNNAPAKELEYLPLSLRYDATWRQPPVTYGVGLGLTANAWYSGSRSNLQTVVGSSQASGHWVTLTPDASVDFSLPRQWDLSVHANGQWASEPLLSIEQFGIGGVNSVPGYHEGEIFGDSGWRMGVEQQTPPHVVGAVYGRQPLTIRGSLYMDYATAYLIDPQGREPQVKLWSTGVGLVASIGPTWQARFLCSLPLISTSLVPRDQPYFNFALTAQF